MTAAVADAVAAVDYDHFVTEPDGSTLPQSSSVTSIQQMLEDLEVRPGHRVLEIGTGSGYTTGLLANLAGADGLVRSVEVFADLVPRAQARLAAAGVTTATVTNGDGYAGDPAGAPYDRVVAWATPHVIPSAWIDQIGQDAAVVAPVKVARLARAHAIVAITVSGGRPTAVSARPGGYIEMHSEPVTIFGLPLRYVDASHIPDDAEPWWLSSAALREVPGVAGLLLDRLRSAPHTSATPLAPGEDLDDFTAWLYATVPVELATAGLSDRFAGIGAATEGGAAFLTDDELITTGNPDAGRILTLWIEEWRNAGRPGWPDITGVVVPSVEGWEVRLTLR
ncbi:protein-L-isoaspartate O-methyltransferase family protein [Promicromonospora iranensis]|uniref:protein-L-isoaspartate O-methyltransferase family protein n=1 Tax=Promicromonospora iranensis TaxID=1105144 RepID=UPI0023A98FF1|nr:methyltransferase domain-containing protein [Promicromonospora iranensis]